MALTKEEIEAIRDYFKISERDNSSTELRIGLLSARINKLVAHLKENPKDFLTETSLDNLIKKRKKLCKRMRSSNKERFNTLAEKIASCPLEIARFDSTNSFRQSNRQ